MLTGYIDNLEASIKWAQCQDDIDVLCMARDRMTQLMEFVSTQPEEVKLHAYQHIDQVLPMEWPLWMEACRYQDVEATNCDEVTVH